MHTLAEEKEVFVTNHQKDTKEVIKERNKKNKKTV